MFEIQYEINSARSLLFGSRDVARAAEWFAQLPADQHHRFITSLADHAVNSVPSDVDLVAEVFSFLDENNLCSPVAFKDGLLPVARTLDDILIDAPRAFEFFATLQSSAGLEGSARCILTRSPTKTANSPVLHPSEFPSREPSGVHHSLYHATSKLLRTLEEHNIAEQTNVITSWLTETDLDKDNTPASEVTEAIYRIAIMTPSKAKFCAQVCRRICDQDPRYRRTAYRDSEKTGARCFWKALMNHVQSDYESGRVTFLDGTPAIGTRANTEADQAEEAKRLRVNLYGFMGELFEAAMITERVAHAIVRKLCTDLLVDCLWEGYVECLHTFLLCCGQSMDTPRAEAHFDVYFTRIEELERNPNLGASDRRMLQVRHSFPLQPSYIPNLISY